VILAAMELQAREGFEFNSEELEVKFSAFGNFITLFY
jgi:hypothetical protein